MRKAHNQNKDQEIKYLKVAKKEEGEEFAIVTQLLGASRVKVLTEEGKEINCRIPGKLKKKIWLRENDVIIVKKWDFDPENADVVWRYLGFQVEHLKKKGYLKTLPV